MASADYKFVTRWAVDGSPAEVYAILDDAPALPVWWPAVYLSIEQRAPGDAYGVGKAFRVLTKGWLPYTIRWTFRVTKKRPPYGFQLEAHGEFVGTGEWTFAADGPRCVVTYDWRIRAEKPLLRRLSFFLKPVFSANHRWAMAKGEESLKLELLRRRARTPEERAAVPPPPGPTFVRKPK